MSNNGNFGGLTLIKKGRAHPVWRARVVVDGQRHTRNFTLRVDAEAWLDTLRHQFTTNTFEAARAAERITLREAIARYRTERVAIGDTAEQMKKLDAVNRHGGAMLELPLASVMPLHVRDYRERRMAMPSQARRRQSPDSPTPARLNPKTVNKEISALSVVFRHARAEWGFGTLQNPTADIRLDEEDADIAQRVPPKMQEQLIRAAEEYERHPDCSVHIAAYVQCALGTTARLSALSKAKWTDIAASGKTMEVPIANSKSGKRYSVMLTAKTREVLAKLPRTSEYIFGGRPSAISTAWNRLKRRAGVDVRMTDLRHEGISDLFERQHELGLSDFEISLVSSHLTYAAQRRYIHLKSAAVVDKIDKNNKSEMQRFVDALLVTGDHESLLLASAVARKLKEFEERSTCKGVTIDGLSGRVQEKKALSR